MADHCKIRLFFTFREQILLLGHSTLSICSSLLEPLAQLEVEVMGLLQLASGLQDICALVYSEFQMACIPLEKK